MKESAAVAYAVRMKRLLRPFLAQRQWNTNERCHFVSPVQALGEPGAQTSFGHLRLSRGGGVGVRSPEHI